MIKYHDNKNGKQYGDDGKLTNNWNPEADYNENEYINVYFRIECSAYDGLKGFTNKHEEAKFNNEKMQVFQKLGWFIDKQDFNGCCMEVSNGKANLYLHPQEFSGIVKKKDVKTIAEALESNETFSIRWVDLYETVYTMTDDEYESYLWSKEDDIKKLLYNVCRTKRTNKYKYHAQIVQYVAEQVHLPRIGCKSVYEVDLLAENVISTIISKMLIEGYLKCISQDGFYLIRSLNKTELKQTKLKAIA